MDQPGDDDGAPAHAGSGTPTVAVALHYDDAADSVPQVVASGRGRLAEQILELAFANGVKVRQDADLAGLLSAVEVGEDIPVEALLAVAEVLAYVYRANGTLSRLQAIGAPNGAPDGEDEPP